MKSEKTIKIPTSEIEKIINELSLVVVSIDRIGSTYHDDANRRAIELHKYFAEVKMFKRLAKARAVLTLAYQAQTPEADVLLSEEAAETLPYWKPISEKNS